MKSGLTFLRSIDAIIAHQRWYGTNASVDSNDYLIQRPMMSKELRFLCDTCGLLKSRGQATPRSSEGPGVSENSPLTTSDTPLHVFKDVVPHVLKFLRAYLEVLFTFDVRAPDYFRPDTGRMVLIRMSNWSIENFVSYAKYMTAWPMARFLHWDLPERPESFVGSPFPFGGPVGRYLKNRVISHSWKVASLWFGVLQGVKRGCEVVPDIFVQEALKKHHAAMQRKSPSLGWSITNEIFDLAEVVTKHFKTSPVRLHEGSSSACMEKVRSEGGQHDYIMKSWFAAQQDREGRSGLSSKYKNKNKKDVIEPTSSGPMEASLRLSLGLGSRSRVPCETVSVPVLREMRETGVFSSYLLPEIDDLLREASKMVVGPSLGGSLVDINRLDSLVEASMSKSEVTYDSFPGFEDIRDITVMRPRPVPLPTKVEAVREPLKVRIITKGPALPYYLAKPFQRDMHTYLKGLKQFKLIGKKGAVSSDDILELKRDSELFQDLVRKRTGSEIVLNQWLSGDYRAATDGINLSVSKICFEAFLRKSSYSDIYKEVLRSVLYEQRLDYPRKSGLSSIQQRIGQLMGSPLSFPILCMVNLIAYWSAINEFVGFNVPMSKLPVLINGDDILFRTNKSLYDIWLLKIKQIGFDLSVGKNYVSTRFLTINSKLFHDGLEIKEIFYLNCGWLTGQSKLGNSCIGKPAPLWSVYNSLTLLAPEETVGRIHRRFVHYNRESIDILTNKGEFNLFSHWAVGGLGFVLPKTVRPRFTVFQRQLGAYLSGLVRQEIVGRISNVDLCRKFWKGIVVKATNHVPYFLERPKYRCVSSFRGEGPLPKGCEFITLEERKLPLMISLRNGRIKDEFISRPLPHEVVVGVRTTPSRIRSSDFNLMNFPFRYYSKPLDVKTFDLGPFDPREYFED